MAYMVSGIQNPELLVGIVPPGSSKYTGFLSLISDQ